MSFIKIGTPEPVLDTFEQPNRKRIFNENGDVVYTDLSEDATILDVINDSFVEELDDKSKN